ncbi:hypothetical protein NQZ68_032037 [Dissostichus eleginoides]|nr:hypothetical protein NQZ68_032037 [Dissostichus eleginoides]
MAGIPTWKATIAKTCRTKRKKLSMLIRHHYPGYIKTRKKEGPTNAPLGAEMNLCWARVLTVYQLLQA